MDNRRFLKHARPFRLAAILLLLLAQPGHAMSTADMGTADDFRQALASGRDGDRDALLRWQATLGDDHPLAAYLDFHRVRLDLDTAGPGTVMDYLRRYADSPLAADMRALAMNHFGEQQDWSALRAISQGVPGNLRLRCFYFRAMLADERQRALDEARKLWLAGRSRPDSCDPLFDTLEEAGILDDQLVWQRMLLAFAEDSPGLMRYLRSKLTDTDLVAAGDRLLSLYRQPREARLLQDSAHAREMIVPALQRLAYKDPVYTRKLLPIMRKRFSLDEAAVDRIAGTVAWYSVIRDEPDNQAWMDSWLASNGSLRLLEQRIRSAIRQQDWAAVDHWIKRLPANERDSARWHYWMARSLEARQQDEQARAHFIKAASQRSFWGFLAAERMAQPLPFNQEPVPASLAELSPEGLQVAERVDLLQQAGEPGLARDEWLWLLRRSDEAQLDALAQLALEREWPHLAVETALYAGRRNVLDWRFPAAFAQAFQQAAQQQDLDPWLLMALSRRESAFNPGA
ncbi:MAG: lytic transglycosylase, partial [Alcanivoracaceae bacterium]